MIAWKAATNDSRVASFRYRVAAPLAALAARGQPVELYDPARAGCYTAVIFSKSYGEADQRLARALRAAGGRTLFDLCDNHFYNPDDLPRYRKARVDLTAMIDEVDQVIVSTPALAEVVAREAQPRRAPIVIGDVAEQIAPEGRPDPARLTLLWFGSHGSPNAPSGMTDLLRIAPSLQAAFRRTAFELVIASNNRDKFARVAPLLSVPARYVEWSQDGFASLLGAADAVLIPLSDNPFVACKTHNRITTALSAGVPVVADAIASYREFAPFAWLDDWDRGLREVLENGPAARTRAASARAYMRRHWSADAIAQQWERALRLEAPLPTSAGPDRPLQPIAESRTYQGAVDFCRGEMLTGWLRRIDAPSRPVRVTLKAEGAILAQGVADLSRPDLAAAGFDPADCGFALPLPKASGATLQIVGDGAVALSLYRPRIAPAAPTSVFAGHGEALAAEPSIANMPDLLSAGGFTTRQDMLAHELHALDAALEQVRSVTARMVLIAGAPGGTEASMAGALASWIEAVPAGGGGAG